MHVVLAQFVLLPWELLCKSGADLGWFPETTWKFWKKYTNKNTVEPRYVELGYPELPAISNRIAFPLDLPLFFSVIYYGLSRTRSSRTARYLELFLAPVSWNQPRLSRTLLHSEEELVKISQEVQSRHFLTRCTESWEMYWRVHGNESKARLTGTANTEGDKLPVFVNFSRSYYYSRNLTPTSLSRTPVISNYFSLPLRVRDSEVLL